MRMRIKERIIHFFSKGNTRSLETKKNIIGSFFLKLISIIISLQIVPLTIDYVNPMRYGIWLTLSSLIAWFSFFDIGLANGFRNKFAEAKAVGKYKLARIYVSTTYAVLLILFFIFLFVIFTVIPYVDWTEILKVDPSYKKELNSVFEVVSIFWGINLVASTFTTMLVADQKTVYSSFVQISGQFIAFIIIYVLTRFSSGSLIYLAFVFSGIPVVTLIFFSIWAYNGRYRRYAPNIKYVRFSFVRQIIGLGGQFFIITISSLIIFQLMNIIISRLEGPNVVTQYNIAYKYFNVLFMVFIIVLTPFWSAFTDAFYNRDYCWMKTAMHKLERLWLLCIPVTVLMILIADFFYKVWLGNSVVVPLSMNIAVGLFMLFQILGGIYMYLINGIGKVRLQLIVYFFFSVFSFPIMYYMCSLYSIQGLLVIPTLVYLVQAVIGRIQLTKIISGEQKGIWNK